MNISQALSYTNAQAITPDQLLSYVSAVSGAQSELVGDYIIHRQKNNIILVGYNLLNPYDTSQLDEVIQQITSKNNKHNITVLAPIRPLVAPENAFSSSEDAYWFVPLPPPKPNDKVRNMLTNSNRHIYITKESGQKAWSGAHQELMLNYIRSKGMEPALCSIMQGLERYLIASSQVELFSAYNKNTNELLAYNLADFSSFTTAFYMFAFRQEKAVGGVADAVLFALLEEAKNRGYNQCNLGLGINDGIRFFKKKWGAKPTLPFIQTTWQIENSKKSWFSRFFD